MKGTVDQRPKAHCLRATRIRACDVASQSEYAGLTCYRLSVATAFPSRDEHDVALARIGILILKNEELVDPVLLEGGDLDYYANWPDQTPVEDDIFLAADLSWGMDA